MASPIVKVEPVVVDTNIVLDVLVFRDAATAPLSQALAAKSLEWLATQAMRDELARVLAYPKIVTRLAFYKLQAEDVLTAFDQHARLVDVAPKCSLTCRDPDDQKFIDLAVAHQALLLSKDRAVLSMAKRLIRQQVRALSAIE